MRHKLPIIFSLTFLFLSIPSLAFAQVDSTYIGKFEEAFSAKIYAVDKSASFEKENGTKEKDMEEITYKTNKPVSLGLGVAWKGFSVSFSYGFDFFRDKKKGKTNSLEFQHHWYGRKFMYDFILQQHKGFYNQKRNDDKTYNLHPDVKMNMYGGTLQYVFNNKKFSYNAAMNQTEKQLKSAGSILAGVSLFYSKVQTDTTVIFEKLTANHENLQFGFSGGYAYTWVINKNWFLSGSASIGLNMGNNYPKHFFKKKMEFYPTINSRMGFGYNSDTWSLGGSAYLNKVYLFFDGEESLSMNNMNFQITFIKRFDWNNTFVNKVLNRTNDKVQNTKKRINL